MSRLHSQIRTARFKEARKLIEAGDCDFDALYDGATPLSLALKCDAAELAELLIAVGADVNKADEEGNCPLHLAALQERSDFVDLLLCKGADANSRNRKLQTPVQIAIIAGKLKTVVSLLGGGAEVAAQDHAGDTALHYSAAIGITLILGNTSAVCNDPNLQSVIIVELGQASSLFGRRSTIVANG